VKRLRRLSAAEQKRRRDDFDGEVRGWDDRFRKEFHVSSEEFLPEAEKRALLLWSMMGGLNLVPRGLPAKADPLWDEFVALVGRIHDAKAPDGLNERAVREWLFELATKRDQAWRNNVPVLALFVVLLRMNLFPPTNAQKQRAYAKHRARQLRKRIENGWKQGVPVGNTKDAIVDSGEFPSLDALDKFLERHGK
jgi:hypothetical protein